MSTTLVIPPLTIPAGTHVLGPLTIPAAWSHFELTLDIALLTSADLLVEMSLNGGVSWRHLVSETGLTVGLDKHGVPITTEHLVATWGDPNSPTPLPPALVRATITNAVAFLSQGGSLLVS